MKLLVDMNLSPDWIPLLEARNWQARHWSEVGPANAPDTLLMSWARQNSHVIMTQDLDFSQLLFSTGDAGPSVVLLRVKDEFDPSSRENIFRALHLAETSLETGALLTIPETAPASANCRFFELGKRATPARPSHGRKAVGRG